MYDDLFGSGPGSNNEILPVSESSRLAHDAALYSLQTPADGSFHGNELPPPQDLSSPGRVGNQGDGFTTVETEIGVGYDGHPPSDSGTYDKGLSSFANVQFGSRSGGLANPLRTDSLYLGAEGSPQPGPDETNEQFGAGGPEMVDRTSKSGAVKVGFNSYYKDGTSSWEVDATVARNLALEKDQEATNTASLQLTHKELGSAEGPEGVGRKTTLSVSHDSSSGWAVGVQFEWKLP